MSNSVEDTSGSQAGERLPELYSGWIGELLSGPIPRETRATCSNCVMCSSEPSGESADQVSFFNPETKCCTFVPTIPNYLVGRCLLDQRSDAAKGRETVLKRIASKVGVNPMGLYPSPLFTSVYGEESFGKSRTLRCPHYLTDGRCGIWRHREGTCATWFCKHVRGRVGYDFWAGALQPLLKELDLELARWCVLETGSTGRTLKTLLSHPSWKGETEPISAEAVDSEVSPQQYSQLWEQWQSREAEFYKECAQKVENLTWNEVLSIGGTRLKGLATLTAGAYEKLVSDRVPRFLKATSNLHLLRLTPQTTRVSTYSTFDPIEFPNPVIDVLRSFDGRSTEVVQTELATERGIAIDDSFIRKLVDFDVLVPEGEIT